MSKDHELYLLQQTIRRQAVEIDRYKDLLAKLKKLFEELIEN